MPALKAIIAAIKSDPTLNADLGEFDFGSGDEPAVFATAAPPEAPSVHVLVSVAGGADYGGRETYGIEQWLDVEIVDDKGRSEKTARAWIMSAREIFHKSALVVEGWSTASVWAEAPTNSVDADGFPSYVLRLRVWMLK